MTKAWKKFLNMGNYDRQIKRIPGKSKKTAEDSAH